LERMRRRRTTPRRPLITTRITTRRKSCSTDWALTFGRTPKCRHPSVTTRTGGGT